MTITFALRTSVLVLLGLGPEVRARDMGPHPTLVVVNQGDHDISLADPVARRQILTVDVDGITGHEAIVSPDGRTA
jgi:hypothetical protein